MAIDTLLLCFCEDSEQNNGVTKPYYMSKGLMVCSVLSYPTYHYSREEPPSIMAIHLCYHLPKRMSLISKLSLG